VKNHSRAGDGFLFFLKGIRVLLEGDIEFDTNKSNEIAGVPVKKPLFPKHFLIERASIADTNAKKAGKK
jgi:hypothetical protein